ncbi:MAG TPA: TonB-dependent receptor [Candidatus Kapabacteria bacterium]|nr:TonB-dependent receptor [Candidatus Kapabacteria bacterium]
MKILIKILLAFTLSVYCLFAESSKDSLKVYRLGALSVDAFKDKQITESSIYTINYAAIKRTDLVKFSEIQQIIPSARIRTNSRGESLIFLRGIGERSVGVFLDGIPLNIAWDNRIDLSMVPSDVIGGIDVNTNASSILLGSNVVGGALNINTFERASEGNGFDLSLRTSNSDNNSISLTSSSRNGAFNSIISLSYNSSMGNLNPNKLEPSITGANIFNQNIDDKYRTNTNYKNLSLYTRGEYKLSDNFTIGLSYLSYSGSKGVAPEYHLDSNSARYWIYPEFSRNLIGLNLEYIPQFGFNSILRVNSWYDKFTQTIDSYTNYDYMTLNDKQNDNDNSLGLRLNYQIDLSSSQYLLIGINYLNSYHTERYIIGDLLEYEQNNLNIGLQYGGSISNLSYKVGGVYDNFTSPLTGEFVQNRNLSQSDWGAFLSLEYKLTEYLSVYSNLSRRTRFPTMRESYTGGLNKFIVNPDLKAETGVITDLGAKYTHENFSINLSAFYTDYSNMIVRIRLPKEQDSLRRRMRVNIAEANVIGSTLDLNTKITDKLSLNANITYMKSEGKESGVTKDWLDNRPEFNGGLDINYNFNFGLSVVAEADIIAGNYEQNPDDVNNKIELASNTFFNFRLAYNKININGALGEVYLRANNIFDSYREIQLGLYDPGRTLYLGLKLSI